MRLRVPACLVLLMMAIAGVAAAQSIPFQILLTIGNNSATVPNDSSVGFVSEVGQVSTVQVKATYTGTGQVTFATQPQLLGSSNFTAAISGTLPIMLAPGTGLPFSITYKATSAAGATSQLTIPYTETVGSGSTATTTQNIILLTLVGSTPSYQLSYVLSSSQNVVPLPSGGAIPFPATQVNTSVTALLNISNVGSGPGQITAITQPTNPAFKVSGIPLFPFSLASGTSLTLQVTYTPTAATTDTDQIQITLGSGTVLTVGLTGSGTTSMFTYQLVQNGTPTPITPPGPIALPDTNVGSTNSVIVQVQNTGNATGIINSPPSTAGAGYTLSDVPVFPQTLKAGGSFTFTVNFTPTQTGVQKGTLVVGSDLFTLTGNGLGSNLMFSYMSAAGTITLGPNNQTVVFSPIPVTQNEKVTFTVMNAGTASATVSNIGIGEANSPFSVSGLPPLPVTVAAGGSFQFTIAFAPATLGFLNGTLRLDTTVITLTGSGTAPPALPSYTIQGPSGTVTPGTQPAVGLTLANSYPVDLTGILTISSSGNLIADPAVQFSTGGRTVQFTIPANSTSANFEGLGSQIFLQTGTVASNITLTPSFATAAGNIDVTPSSPTTLQFSVPASAPVLIAVNVVNEATNGFTLVVTGYSTTRSLTSITVQFTVASGFNLTSSQTTVDLSQVAALWFQSSASEAFGGQFLVSLPFTIQGKIPLGDTLGQVIPSVSATVTNEVGTSNSLPTALQ